MDGISTYRGQRLFYLISSDNSGGGGHHLCFALEGSVMDEGLVDYQPKGNPLPIFSWKDPKSVAMMRRSLSSRARQAR